MKNKVSSWFRWAKQRPTVIVNIVGIMVIVFGALGYLIYQQTRSIDVLSDWTITISAPTQTRDIEGETVAVYNPGDSLTFISQSVKVTEAKGSTVRTIVCEATATQKEREIQLDTIPAGRPVGVSPERESAIVIPDVSQFAGLPRWCKLIIDITYEDVAGTGRSWAEHAETARFLVEEEPLDPAAVRAQINTLTDRIDELEKLIPSNEGSVSEPTSNAAPRLPASPNNTTTNNTTTNNTTNNTTTPPPAEDNSTFLNQLPLVGPLLGGLGL